MRKGTTECMCRQKINDAPQMDMQLLRVRNQAHNIILYTYPL